MATPVQSNSWRWLSRWQSGGVLVLASLGLHGLLLGMPMPRATQPEEPVTLLLPADTTAPIDVVRIPVAKTTVPPAPEPDLSAQPSQSQAAPTLRAEAEPPTNPQHSPPPEPSAEASADPAPPPPPESAPEDISPGLVYNNQVKTLRTDTQSFLEWYSSQDWGTNPDQIPLPGPKELAPLQVSYTLSQCLVPPPAPGRLEVIVAANGALTRAPRLLATTGYDDLDGLAIEQATQQNFAEAANAAVPNPTVYWLPVDVRYDGANCQP